MGEQSNNAAAIVSRETIDQVAGWIGATVSSAFFSSLERFSCVNVSTEDSDDDEEADDRPSLSPIWPTPITNTTSLSSPSDFSGKLSSTAS